MIFITSSGDVSLGNTLRLTGFGIDLWAAPADDGASWAWSGEDERTERVRRVATIRNVRGMPRLRSGECDAKTRTHCCTAGFVFLHGLRVNARRRTKICQQFLRSRDDDDRHPALRWFHESCIQRGRRWKRMR